MRVVLIDNMVCIQMASFQFSLLSADFVQLILLLLFPVCLCMYTFAADAVDDCGCWVFVSAV